MDKFSISEISEHLWKVITAGPYQALFSKSSYSEYFFIVSVGLRNTNPLQRCIVDKHGLQAAPKLNNEIQFG